MLSGDMGDILRGTEVRAMPWTETSPMTERQRFIDEALRGEASLESSCAAPSASVARPATRGSAATWTRAAVRTSP